MPEELNDTITYARSRAETLAHIQKVQGRIGEVQRNLFERAQQHDLSKLHEPEIAGYAQLQTRLADVSYGTQAYRDAENDHHPEHYSNGVADMSLMALIEMICDWKAASERTRQGGIAQSLDVNEQRFGLDPQLASILRATIAELGW